MIAVGTLSYIYMNGLKLVSKSSKALMAVVLAAMCLPVITACGDKDNANSAFPKDFNKKTDEEKVAYMMKQATPDSVARFICYAAMGDIPGVKIDTLAMATLYAYENYKDKDLDTFGHAYDTFSEQLPLHKKMLLRKLIATEDPMQLGYSLGLEYVNSIRIDRKSAKAVEEEIAQLKSECAKNPEDSAMYTRFLKGFQVALTIDGSSDVPKEIFNKYGKL